MVRWSVRGSAVIAVATALGCGPSVQTPAAGATESGSGTEAGADADAGTSAAASTSSSTSSSSADPGSTGAPPFMCSRGEELLPGLCFERYPVELPGPMVGTRTTGANVDGLGGDEIVVEVVLDGEQRLALLRFDAEVGTTFEQEVAPTWHEDYEGTELFTADVGQDGLEEVYRTMVGMLNVCALDPDGTVTCSPMSQSNVEDWRPAQFARIYDPYDQGLLYLISQASSVFDVGLNVYDLGFRVGSTIGSFHGARSCPPCEDPVSVGHGDFNADGYIDVIHHSSTDCVGADDPRRDDVNLLLGLDGNDLDVGTPGDAEVEPTLMVVVDADADGIDDVLVHDPSLGATGYRWLPGTPAGFGVARAAHGPSGVDRLVAADVDGDGGPEVLFAGAAVLGLGRASFEAYELFEPLPGRLLCVVDVDGDGRDDLLLTGSDDDELLLLVVTD